MLDPKEINVCLIRFNPRPFFIKSFQYIVTNICRRLFDQIKAMILNILYEILLTCRIKQTYISTINRYYAIEALIEIVIEVSFILIQELQETENDFQFLFSCLKCLDVSSEIFPNEVNFYFIQLTRIQTTNCTRRIQLNIDYNTIISIRHIAIIYDGNIATHTILSIFCIRSILKKTLCESIC